MISGQNLPLVKYFTNNACIALPEILYYCATAILSPMSIAIFLNLRSSETV